MKAHISVATTLALATAAFVSIPAALHSGTAKAQTARRVPARTPLPRRTDSGVAPRVLATDPRVKYSAALELGGQTASTKVSAVSTTQPQGFGGGISPDAGLVGLDLRYLFALPFGAPVVPVIVAEQPFVRGFVGMRLRRYFSVSGDQLAFSIHPTPGQDTFLSYQMFYAVKAYVGLMYMLADPFGAAGAISHLGVSPYAGLNFERGRLRLATDESGGGGVSNVFSRSATRVGPAVGVDFDFHFRNLPFFIGLGLQLDFMPSMSGSGVSGNNNFNYDFRRGTQTNFSGALRVGFLFASDARLKRDIAEVGKLTSGIALYRYRYLWDDTEYVGVMAQEAAEVVPDAVTRGADGWLRVDYGKLGTRLMTWHEWRGPALAEMANVVH